MSEWRVPERRIFEQRDLARWAASPARADLVAFVRSLSQAVRRVSLTADVPTSAAVLAVVALLQRLEARVPRRRRRAPAPLTPRRRPG